MTGKHERAQSLPKAGALCAQWVRCGTSGCRCNRGELHGPYYYWFWREGGRLRKRYVRLSDVLTVRAELEARRAHDQFLRNLVADGWSEWRGMIAQVREVEHGEP